MQPCLSLSEDISGRRGPSLPTISLTLSSGWHDPQAQPGIHGPQFCHLCSTQELLSVITMLASSSPLHPEFSLLSPRFHLLRRLHSLKTAHFTLKK